jgi:peptidase MA superfamily protein
MVAALLFLAQLAQAQSEASWRSEDTQHFTIRHESPATSLGDNNRVERIYEALHPVLWQLVPWMTQTKVSIYLYSSRDSFLKGQFNPPPWSGGLMSDSQGVKVLAVYSPMDTSTTAHELTHLYFHTFFDEKSVSPPPWLDEGLAVMLQEDALSMPDPREKGPILPSPIPMKTFMGSRPAQDAPSARVSVWYQQAHSVVRFLRRGHIEDLFTTFCRKIRDGADVETALREVYGYQDLDAFEQAWLKWRPRRGKGLPSSLGE